MNNPAPAAGVPATDPLYLLGVDGGGSKTVAWLARLVGDRPEIVGRGQAGTSNLRAAGPKTALNNLAAAIDAARQQAAWTGPIAAAVLGLAGSANLEVQAAVDQWCASRHIAQRVLVVHDARPVIAAGTPDDWGIALIAGTGSVVYAMSSEGQQIAIAGGWGYLFGDEGSGFWIGREALRRVSRAVDGRAAPTGLTELLQDELQVDDPRELLSALNARGDLREATAALAPSVLSFSEQGDADAQEIAKMAAQELAALVSAAARAIHVEQGFPLAIAGGVLVGSAKLREQVVTALAATKHPPTSVEVVESPVAGCLRMAATVARGV